ncbi:MAG: choice-of-anchor D domain-containing protein, partial [Rubrivivax sp.]|nr:choice-of-anchor D domain-containing protein [Rubrivivax sp.]
ANTAVGPVGFVEGLAAVIGTTTGGASGTGFANAAAGGSGNLVVGLGAIAAGANSGTVSVQLQSNGTTTTGSNGLGSLDLGASQTVTVTGTGWRLAQAGVVAPVSFLNVHVGDVVSQNLTITNTGVADGFTERLNASFGGTSDARITTNSGSVSLLAAGASNSTAMSVGVDTSAAGSINGSVTLNFASDGSGTSGLGLTSLASQNVGVTANITEVNVFRLANALINTAQPVNLGNVRVGSGATQALSITNNVPNDGFSERLNASAGTSSAGITATGSFNLLGAGATNSTNVVVGIDTSSAGAKAGTATIAFVSDGQGTSGLGQTVLASQNVAVQGNVFRLASPQINTGTVTVAARVGDSLTTQGVSITNASPDAFTEGLKVSVAGFSGNAAGSGSIANLAAQGSDTSTIRVGLGSTATAGLTNGSVTLALVSTGAGTTGAADLSLGSQAVTVQGKVYTPAVGQLNTPTVDFGIVRVGQVVAAKDVQVTNAAATTALNDTLRATLAGLSGPFAGNASVGGIVAGANGGMAVTLSTASAGQFSQLGTVSYLSQNPDMADADAGSDSVTVKGQVNSLADAQFRKTGGAGTLSKNGSTWTLDLGTVNLGATLQSVLDVLNAGAGFTDALDASLAFANSANLVLANWSNVDDLAVGSDSLDFDLTFNALATGLFQQSFVLSGFSVNASDPAGIAQSRTLLLRANVVDPNGGGGTVPEPGIVALLGAALAGWWGSRRRRGQGRAYHRGGRTLQ